VELIEVDVVDPQAAETAFAGGSQMFRAAVFDPLVGAGALESTLGGDYQVGGIRMQRFGDELFADVGAVGVGGVDEVDAEFDGAAQDVDGFGVILGRTPNAFSGDAHGAKTETMDVEIVADAEVPGLCGGRICVRVFCGFVLHGCSLSRTILVSRGAAMLLYRVIWARLPTSQSDAGWGCAGAGSLPGTS